MNLSTELYFTTITPLIVTGSASKVDIEYETSMPDYAIELHITEGEEFCTDIELNTAAKKVTVYLEPFVFSVGESGYSTRDISFYLGNESYGDSCTITQVKSNPILIINPENLTVPYADEKQTFNYELNSEDYDFTDLRINTTQNNVEVLKFNNGVIDEDTGQIHTETNGAYSDFITYGTESIIKTEIKSLGSSSGLFIAGYDKNNRFIGIYDEPNYVFDNVTSGIFNTFAKDAITYFSGSAGPSDYKIRIQCNQTALVGTYIYSQTTPNDFVLSNSIDAAGNIAVNTIPNFTHEDKQIKLNVSLPSGDNKQITITKQACTDNNVIPAVEDKQGIIQHSANNYTPAVTESFKVYCPDDWDIRAINNEGTGNFLVEADKEAKVVNILQSRGYQAPEPNKQYKITIQLKPSIANEHEYEAHTFERYVQAKYLLEDALDTTTINVDYTGKSSNIITIHNALVVENFTGYEINNLNGITRDKIVVTLNSSEGTLAIRKIAENTALIDKDMSFDLKLIWGSTATYTYRINVIQEKNTSFEEIPIWKDTYYTLTGENVYYRLLDIKSGAVLYSGKVYPSASKIVKINDIIKDYLIINQNPFTSVFVNNNEYINVLLQTSSDGADWNNIIKYYFFYDYSYKDENVSNIGLNSVNYQVIDKYSPYQYFITTRQFANKFNTYGTVNINLTETEGYGGQTKTINIPESHGEVISCVLSGGVYESIDVIYGSRRPFHVKHYEQSCTDSDWVLYYINEEGGWNWMFFDGKNIESNTIKRNSYLKDNKYNVSYKNDITQTWDLTTKYLTDEQSKLLMQIYKSPIVYMQKLDFDTEPFRVNIDTNTYQVKTWQNQGKKKFTHNVKVSNAMITEWLM